MISKMSLLEQSSLFAKISNCVYEDLTSMKNYFPDYDVRYYGYKGSDAYVLENDIDMIIACRGTEVKETSDIKADLSIAKTSVPEGKVHIGFNHYVDKIWDGILNRGINAKKNGKTIWVTGHSLGAAMATLISYRFTMNTAVSNPTALFTYGSPRVGDKKFINFFNKKIKKKKEVFERYYSKNDDQSISCLEF